jgi:hypothetical protein
MRSTNFKTLSRIWRNVISNCKFLKFLISVTSGHGDYLHWPSESLATPLFDVAIPTENLERYTFKWPNSFHFPAEKIQ